MATGKTGGLNWFGVGKAGGGSQNTSTSVLLNRSKRQRQEQALRGQKVGSAAIQSADDWLAAADANRKFRERDGAVGNPFANAAALVAESQRQGGRGKKNTTLDWSLPSLGEPHTGETTRAPSLYWDHPKDLVMTADDDDDDDDDASASVSGAARPRREEEGPPQEEARRPAEEGALSREELREIEVSVMELRDDLEGDSQVETKCDALRRDLIQQKQRRRREELQRKAPLQRQKQLPLLRRRDVHEEDGVVDEGPPSEKGATTKHGVVVDFDDDDDDAAPGEPELPPRGIVVDFDDDDDD